MMMWVLREERWVVRVVLMLFEVLVMRMILLVRDMVGVNVFYYIVVGLLV